MAKISPVSIKYIIRARFVADGVVEKPDIIGAVFGQTEGLLGDELELRELQKEGRIGRIEVTLEESKGNTSGVIEIPTSIDKEETALIAAALETIERVGPSEANIKVEAIEDVRGSKREYVIERAKRLLKDFKEQSATESTELTSAISESVRMMDITEYGRERLPAGPGVGLSNEIIIVEGRADVLTLLKCGISNAISINGTSAPKTIKELSREKKTTLFIDGDRGGELIKKNLLVTCDINYIARAPDGKEVEELTQKEILKALRDKKDAKKLTERKLIVQRTPAMRGNRTRTQERSSTSRGQSEVRRGFSQARTQARSQARSQTRDQRRGPERGFGRGSGQGPGRSFGRGPGRGPGRNIRDTRNPPQEKKSMSQKEKKRFNELFEELVGTRGAYLLDNQLEALGKIPISELPNVLRGAKAYAVIADGTITQQTLIAAERTGVSFIVAKESQVQSRQVNVVKPKDLK